MKLISAALILLAFEASAVIEAASSWKKLRWWGLLTPLTFLLAMTAGTQEGRDLNAIHLQS